jgi:hypothetical protein
MHSQTDTAPLMVLAIRNLQKNRRWINTRVRSQSLPLLKKSLQTAEVQFWKMT